MGGRAMSIAFLLRYDRIKKLAAELGRPASTLIALAPANDPFSITPGRRDEAQWFSRIWKQLDLGLGACTMRWFHKPSRSKCLMACHTKIRMAAGRP
jgi:hypothetical protein